MILTNIQDYKTNIARHAYKELMLIGMFDGDEYNETIAKNILDLCELFGLQQHSGFTAEYVTDIFNKVSRYKTLSNITNDPTEWEDVSEISDELEGTIFQNKRDCSVFSMDGLKTWKSVDEKLVIDKITNILNEKKVIDIKDSIKYARNISNENKEIALSLLQNRARVKKSIISGLLLHSDLKKKIKENSLPDGFDMGIDKNGFFIHTHRARSKSYSTPDKITIESIKFIDSTG